MSAILTELELQARLIRDAKEKGTPLLASFAADKAIPLAERWDFWCKMPMDFKTKAPWIENFYYGPEKDPNAVEGKYSYYMRPEFFDCEMIPRYSVANLANEVQSLQENLDCIDPDEPNEYDPDYTQEDIDNLKEDILGRNLGSFVMDW